MFNLRLGGRINALDATGETRMSYVTHTRLVFPSTDGFLGNQNLLPGDPLFGPFKHGGDGPNAFFVQERLAFGLRRKIQECGLDVGGQKVQRHDLRHAWLADFARRDSSIMSVASPVRSIS